MNTEACHGWGRNCSRPVSAQATGDCVIGTPEATCRTVVVHQHRGNGIESVELRL